MTCNYIQCTINTTIDHKGLVMDSAISFLFLPAKEVVELSGHEQSELHRHAFEFWQLLYFSESRYLYQYN